MEPDLRPSKEGVCVYYRVHWTLCFCGLDFLSVTQPAEPMYQAHHMVARHMERKLCVECWSHARRAWTHSGTHLEHCWLWGASTS